MRQVQILGELACLLVLTMLALTHKFILQVVHLGRELFAHALCTSAPTCPCRMHWQRDCVSCATLGMWSNNYGRTKEFLSLCPVCAVSYCMHMLRLKDDSIHAYSYAQVHVTVKHGLNAAESSFQNLPPAHTSAPKPWQATSMLSAMLDFVHPATL